MLTEPIAAVLVHVSDVQVGLAWYQQAFPIAVRSRVEAGGLEFLSIAGVQLELVPSDEQVASDACGSVVYWHVANLQSALHHMQSIGAKMNRGPMRIEDGLSMCQVRDPWGNCIGLRGPNAL